MYFHVDEAYSIGEIPYGSSINQHFHFSILLCNFKGTWISIPFLQSRSTSMVPSSEQIAFCFS